MTTSWQDLTGVERQLILDWSGQHRVSLKKREVGDPYQGWCSCGWASQVHDGYTGFHNEETAFHDASYPVKETCMDVARSMLRSHW